MASRERKRPELATARHLLRLAIQHAAQYLALPVHLVYRPALDRPVIAANRARPAVTVHILPAFFLRRRELPVDGPGVAPPPVDVIVVNHGDDARRGQVEHPPGDDFVARRGVALLEREEVIR